MMHLKKRILAGVWAVIAVFAFSNGAALVSAAAQNTEGDLRFCDDAPTDDEMIYYDGDDPYYGSGAHYDVSYTLNFDYKVEHFEYEGADAAAITAGGIYAENSCTGHAGACVVGFYDRFYPNLIPDYEPGITSNGVYIYMPDLGQQPLKDMFTKLYNYMQINVGGPGATEEEFKTGLKRYVNEQGCTLSYTTFHKNSSTVNIDRVRYIAPSFQVGVVFMSEYNFVYGFTDTATSRNVIMEYSQNGHVMMVYGVYTVDYYKNGSIFLSETYLQALTCNSSGRKVYLKMNDHIKIVDALIVNVG